MGPRGDSSDYESSKKFKKKKSSKHRSHHAGIQEQSVYKSTKTRKSFSRSKSADSRSSTSPSKAKKAKPTKRRSKSRSRSKSSSTIRKREGEESRNSLSKHHRKRYPSRENYSDIVFYHKHDDEDSRHNEAAVSIKKTRSYNHPHHLHRNNPYSEHDDRRSSSPYSNAKMEGEYENEYEDENYSSFKHHQQQQQQLRRQIYTKHYLAKQNFTSMQKPAGSHLLHSYYADPYYYDGQNHHQMYGAAADSAQQQIQPIMAMTGMYEMNYQMQQQQQQYQQAHFPTTQPRMLSFREYVQQCLDPNDKLNKFDAVRQTRYNQYKEKFRAEQIEAFFNEHKLEDWFRARYHPKDSLKRKQEQRKWIQNRLKIFTSCIKKYPSIQLNAASASQENLKPLYTFLDECVLRMEENDNDESNSRENTQTISRRSRSVNREKKDDDQSKDDGEDSKLSEGEIAHSVSTNTIPKRTQSIFFKNLPVNITRLELEKIGKKFEGFKRVAVSEPAPDRGFCRRAWMTFKPDVDIKSICTQINKIKFQDAFSLNASINREISQKVKFISGLANHVRIIRSDLKIISKIVENLDQKFCLWSEDEPNELLSSAKEYLSQIEKYVEVDENKKTRPAAANEYTIVSTTTRDENKLREETSNAENTYCDMPEEAAAETLNHAIISKRNKTPHENHDNNDNQDEANEQDLLIFNNEEENLNLYEDLNHNQHVSTTTINAQSLNSNYLKIEEEEFNVRELKCNQDGFVMDERASHLLDYLILYLRIVHSIDYYNATEYLQEDLMPYKSGVLHIRGCCANKSAADAYAAVDDHCSTIIYGEHVNKPFDPAKCKKEHIDEWLHLFANHIRQITEAKEPLDLETAKRFGLKDVKIETERFLNENTCQKRLDKNNKDNDLWLCALNEQRKFKTKEEVRKYIQTKYAHMIKDLEEECEFFNKFLMDPKRPYLPEHPMNRAGAGSMMNSMMMGQQTTTMHSGTMNQNQVMAIMNYPMQSKYVPPGQMMHMMYYDFNATALTATASLMNHPYMEEANDYYGYPPPTPSSLLPYPPPNNQHSKFHPYYVSRYNSSSYHDNNKKASYESRRN